MSAINGSAVAVGGAEAGGGVVAVCPAEEQPETRSAAAAPQNIKSVRLIMHLSHHVIVWV